MFALKLNLILPQSVFTLPDLITRAVCLVGVPLLKLCKLAL
jgi:hypothetical protein